MTQPPADQDWFTPPAPTRPYGAPPDPSLLRPGPAGPARQARTAYRGVPPLAAAWQRLVARIIDGILVTILAVAVGFPVFTRYYSRVMDLYDQAQLSGSMRIDATTETLAFEALVILYGVYFCYELVQLGMWGRTVGKLALGLRVVDTTTLSKPEWGRAAGRAAVFTLPPIVPTIGGLFVLLDMLWLLWDRPLRQCIHDKAARTIVVTA